MRRFMLLRLVQIVVVMAGVTVLCFLMLKITPGDPATAILGVQASPEEVARVRRSLGLDQPWLVQLGIWAGNVMRGDLGASYINKKPVSELIMTRLPITLELTFWSMLIAVAIAIPAGVLSALRRYTWVDYFFTGFSLFGVSMPSFWFGILLIFVFSLWLGWLPASGYVPWSRGIWPHLRSMILPSVALGLFLTGALMRFSRAAMIETLVQDYIRTARAKGLANRRIVIGHALRNAMIPTVTVLGIQFGALLGGAVIIETVFAFPGVGTMLLIAVNQRDYPVVMGVTLVVALLYTLSNLAVDLAYTWLNPRIRFG